jgi:hypothetical protein
MKVSQFFVSAPAAYLRQYVFAQSIIYHLAINLVKASFVLQYIRLFPLVIPVIYTCYVLLVLIVGAASWGIFGSIFLCKPVRAYWDITVSGNCLDAEDHFLSSSIIGIVLDWVIWLLPMPVVARLRLPLRQKLGLVIVFGLGILCVYHALEH